ncbi:unnamed protein product, partial [Staurois parvus]
MGPPTDPGALGQCPSFQMVSPPLTDSILSIKCMCNNSLCFFSPWITEISKFCDTKILKCFGKSV